MTDFVAHGPGKYDDACTLAREKAEAQGAILLIFGGNKGEGFSVQAPEHIIRRVPKILRTLADLIEKAEGNP